MFQLMTHKNSTFVVCYDMKLARNEVRRAASVPLKMSMRKEELHGYNTIL